MRKGIPLKAGFLKLPELLVGKNNYLFHLKTGLSLRHRPQWVLPIEVVDMAGPVIKNSVLLIGFRFLQGDVFFRHVLQVDAAVIAAVAKIQGIVPLGDQHIFFFPFGPHHEAAEQAARIGAHDFPVILEEGVFRGNVLREFFKILFAQDDNLCHFKNAGDVAYLVPAQAVQCFCVCRERGVLFFSQYLHLSFLE